MKNPAIRFTDFDKKYQKIAKELILEGLGEHWGYIDPFINEDLMDIETSYFNDKFILAWFGDEIVGTGALIKEEPEVLRLVRMSVKKTFRRQGIGNKVIDSLLEYARGQGCKRVVLETTSTWKAIIQFYLNYGFSISHDDGTDTHFELNLLND